MHLVIIRVFSLLLLSQMFVSSALARNPFALFTFRDTKAENIFIKREYKYLGYLRHNCPVPLIYKYSCRPFDRNQLISLISLEEKREKDVILEAEKQAALLDAAHKVNLLKVQKTHSYTVESPTEIVLHEETSPHKPFSPDEFLIYLKDHKDQKGKTFDNEIVPFEMPYQEHPLPLHVIPSKSIYERK